jgi:hypothetical protein
MAAVMDALILIAENGGPTLLEGIGVMRTLNRPHVWVFSPDRKGQAEAEAGQVTK